MVHFQYSYRNFEPNHEKNGTYQLALEGFVDHKIIFFIARIFEGNSFFFRTEIPSEIEYLRPWLCKVQIAEDREKFNINSFIREKRKKLANFILWIKIIYILGFRNR